jgi:hypothetical protein
MQGSIKKANKPNILLKEIQILKLVNFFKGVIERVKIKNNKVHSPV